MIYVTGDLHGDPARLSDKALRRLKKGDTLLVCGDFGFVWDGSPAELKLRRKIGKQKYTTIFVDGTHDNLPMIREFPEEEYAGGTVRRIEGNLLYAERGTILTLEGKKVFFLGGGVSEDMVSAESGTWHSEEMPAAEELAAAEEHLTQSGGWISSSPISRPTGCASSWAATAPKSRPWEPSWTGGQEMQFGSWYFGRLHKDKKIPPRQQAVFREVVPAEQR